MSERIGIVIPTFRKLDGSTYVHLKRTLESVRDQTYQNYKVYLIGDDYTDMDELTELSKIITPERLYLENLPVAVERVKYERSALWYCCGVNANYIGVQKALSEGIRYCCYLNHDDIFYPNHLETLAQCIKETGTNFMATKCLTYPPVETDKLYNDYRPQGGRLYTVSVCMNFTYFQMFQRNTTELGIPFVADFDLWTRVTEFLTARNEYGVFINKQTCEKIGGGDVKYKPEIIK